LGEGEGEGEARVAVQERPVDQFAYEGPVQYETARQGENGAISLGEVDAFGAGRPHDSLRVTWQGRRDVKRILGGPVTECRPRP
jgi:hypothetical protein